MVAVADQDAEVAGDREAGDTRPGQADDHQQMLGGDFAEQLGPKVDYRGIGLRQGDPECAEDDDLGVRQRDQHAYFGGDVGDGLAPAELDHRPGDEAARVDREVRIKHPQQPRCDADRVSREEQAVDRMSAQALDQCVAGHRALQGQQATDSVEGKSETELYPGVELHREHDDEGERDGADEAEGLDLDRADGEVQGPAVLVSRMHHVAAAMHDAGRDLEPGADGGQCGH